MDLVKKRSLTLLIPTVLFTLTLIALAGWWLYLISEGIPQGVDIYSLVKWEGLTFITVLLFLLLIVLYLSWLDKVKVKTMRDFFSSLTHELKTPLAAIRLQSEVIYENIKELKYDNLPLLSQRLTRETLRLEIQMDKILQLSRVEQGGELNLRSLSLKDFIAKEMEAWEDQLQISLSIKSHNFQVMADDFALTIILRNLFENTYIHSREKKVQIEILDETVFYRDGGHFEGHKKHIGKLFYKYNSPQGSGIGIYLIKKLMEQMNGQLSIQTLPRLEFFLKFKRCR